MEHRYRVGPGGEIIEHAGGMAVLDMGRCPARRAAWIEETVGRVPEAAAQRSVGVAHPAHRDAELARRLRVRQLESETESDAERPSDGDPACFGVHLFSPRVRVAVPLTSASYQPRLSSTRAF